MTTPIQTADLLNRAADTLLPIAADHPTLAAGVVALLGSWVLYGVLGKRFLGADDDYWEVIRRNVIPMLSAIAARYPMFYAEARSSNAELVGIVQQGEEQFERTLEDLGYTRNPLSSLKTNPKGWEEDGSWAKRYRSIRWMGDGLRAWADRRSIPGPGFVAGMIGRFLQALGDILALRQVHIWYFVDPDLDGAVWVYAHDEPNALNPLTAWRHYRGVGKKKALGVRKARDQLTDAGVDYVLPDA